MCGNAVRCIGKYVYERGMTTKNVITLETLGGIKTLQLHIQNDIVIAVQIPLIPKFRAAIRIKIGETPLAIPFQSVRSCVMLRRAPKGRRFLAIR